LDDAHPPGSEMYVVFASLYSTTSNPVINHCGSDSTSHIFKEEDVVLTPPNKLRRLRKIGNDASSISEGEDSDMVILCSVNTVSLFLMYTFSYMLLLTGIGEEASQTTTKRETKAAQEVQIILYR
jgi:hypothetical protein